MDSRQLECTVSGAVALVLRISRIFGSAPLRMCRRGNGWLISVSPKMSIYSIVLVSTLSIILMAGLFRDLYADEKQRVRIISPMKSIVWIVDVLVMLLFSSVAVGGAPVRLRRMIYCLNRIQMTNTGLENDSAQENLTRKKCIPVILLILLTVAVNLLTSIISLCEVYYNNADWTIALMYICLYILHIIKALTEVQFIIVVLLVNSSLQAVNDVLAHLLYVMDLKGKSDFKQASTITRNPFSTSKTISDSRLVKSMSVDVDPITGLGKNNSDYCNMSSCTSRMTYKTVRHLALSHSLICDIVRKIDKSNGVLLIFLLVTILLHLVITPYNFLNAVLTQTMQSENILMQLGWSFLHVFNMVNVIEPCHRTQEEMDRTQLLVCKLIRHVTCRTDPLSNELDLFARQLALNQAKFAPLGMFTLGRPLIASILGGVTTYLVIIIQFQK